MWQGMAAVEAAVRGRHRPSLARKRLQLLGSGENKGARACGRLFPPTTNDVGRRSQKWPKPKSEKRRRFTAHNEGEGRSGRSWGVRMRASEGDRQIERESSLLPFS